MKKEKFRRKLGKSDHTEYRYKFNSNSKRDNQSLEGHTLSKETWYRSPNEVKELKKFVKTKSNPEGVLDYQVYQPQNNSKIVFDSLFYFEAEPTFYNRDELGTMSRPELIECCRTWEIDPVKIKDRYLVLKIIEKQKEYESNIKSLDDLTT